MTTITRKQALEECRDMWRAIAEHPEWWNRATAYVNSRKTNEVKLIALQHIGKDPDYYIHHCPCCRYNEQEDGFHPSDDEIDCDFCPLVHIWGNDYGCENNSTSPYFKFRSEGTTPEKREREALRLVKFCEDAIKQIDSKEKPWG